MKQSIYDNINRVLKAHTIEESIKYYQFMLDNNPISSVYPKELRELHEGIVIGLKCGIANKEVV